MANRKQRTLARELSQCISDSLCPPELLIFIDNRPAFLAAIRRFCWNATRVELSEMKSAIRKREARLHVPAKGRGRPRAEENLDWIAQAWAVSYGLAAYGWTWKQAAIASGLKPTKPNIRTVQRRQAQLARMIAEQSGLPIDQSR